MFDIIPRSKGVRRWSGRGPLLGGTTELYDVSLSSHALFRRLDAIHQCLALIKATRLNGVI